ncbi:UbiA prenyltransferase family protein [Bacteroidota bacterium]
MKNYIGLFRVQQWVKNLFLFLPAFFARAFNTETGFHLVLAFLVFSVLASSVYILNDIIDAPADRLHPEKKHRPIAANKIGAHSAGIIGLIMAAVALTCAYFISLQFLFACCIYLTLNLAYSFGLKKIALIDITIVSIGFLIRLFIGGVISNVPISNWMYIMTFLLAMLLSIGKRRDDLLILKNEDKQISELMPGYSLAFVNVVSVMLSTIIIVAYIMYSISKEVTTRVGSEYVYVTSLFVFLGILRYLQLAFIAETTGNPTNILLKDNPIKLAVLGWILTYGIFLYW